MMLASSCHYLLLTAVLLRSTFAADGDLCYILGANSALLGDRLYFMGGNYSITTSSGQEVAPSGSLYWIDLIDDLPIQKVLPRSAYSAQPIDPSATVATSNAEFGLNINNWGSTGTLWNTQDTLYVFGGTNDGHLTNTLSAYNVSTGTWKDVRVIGGPFNFDLRNASQSISVPDIGMNYIFGGVTPYMSGMVEFNATDSSGLSWTNNTNPDMPELEAGTLVYIPAGDKGMLISFGGGNLTTGISPSSGWPYDSDWSTIYIYDIASSTWWSQEASGDAPRTIGGACAVAAVAPDNSAYHITIYGGWSLWDWRAYESVFTLSLPSFTWTNVTSTSALTNREQQVDESIGTAFCNCHIYNNSQMVVLGGNIHTGKDLVDFGSCRDDFSPLRVLDLSTYEWQTHFDPTKEYQVPSAVYSVIGGGGDGSGGATQTAPLAGWADPALSAAMQKRVGQSTTSTSITFASSSATNTPTTDGNPGFRNRHRRRNIGAIAGGVVGGVVLVAAIIGALLFFWRRRRRQRVAPPYHGEPVMIQEKDGSPFAGAELPVAKDLHELQDHCGLWELEGEGERNVVYELEHPT